MDANKVTKRNLKRLTNELGPAWDSPKSSRRQESTATSSKDRPPQPSLEPPSDPERAGRKNRFSHSPSAHRDRSASKMSSRGSQRRGPNRNSEIGEHGEELGMWKDTKEKIPVSAENFNESSQTVRDIAVQEKLMAEKRKNGTLTLEDHNELDRLMRKGVKDNEAASQSLTELIERVKVLRAVQKAKEDQQEASTSRAADRRNKDTSVAAASSLYDFESESPVPSPNPATSRIGGVSKGDRDSVPRGLGRSTPAAKAGSAEPQTGPTSSSMRAKQTFTKDDEVAFKPKPTTNEQTDWILGIVQEVRGDGKSRRYRVLDADVDEHGHQKDFRTSASSMILIPKEGTVLPPLETGKTVLALYPNTTTFYKAEVMGMDDGRVNLKFEGEESSNTMQAVTRRHVVEYRG
ncbi:hypothetical protein M426DRAFT_26082 [Hypoxylon sp. CI-4A]|nr:hypothetical protein M426DRAFT_26082 [Hypoxylon sp. CI-4A]